MAKFVYYELEETEMQELIDQAKNGNHQAQIRLLEIFNNFLSKYVALLYWAKFDVRNYDMRRFISLYIKDPGLKFYLLRDKLNPGGVKQVNEAMRGIQYMIVRYGDEEDVRQTVNMTFFQCINKYERKESKAGGYVPFSGFLYSYFFYLLKRNVDSLLIGQLGRKTFPLLGDDDFGGDESDENLTGFHAPSEPSAEDLIGPEEIDELWVEGSTCYPPFDTLSVQERQLLKWRYVDGLRASEIAQKTSEHSNTCRDNLNKISVKISLELQKMDLI